MDGGGALGATGEQSRGDFWRWEGWGLVPGKPAGTCPARQSLLFPQREVRGDSFVYPALPGNPLGPDEATEAQSGDGQESGVGWGAQPSNQGCRRAGGGH